MVHASHEAHVQCAGLAARERRGGEGDGYARAWHHAAAGDGDDLLSAYAAGPRAARRAELVLNGWHRYAWGMVTPWGQVLE